MMAWVWGVSCASRASKEIWKVSVSAGTMRNAAPQPSTKGRYSGKKGAMARISASSTVSARITDSRAGAAPQVKKMFSPRIAVPKRRFRSSATAFLASMPPVAGV